MAHNIKIPTPKIIPVEEIGTGFPENFTYSCSNYGTGHIFTFRNRIGIVIPQQNREPEKALDELIELEYTRFVTASLRKTEAALINSNHVAIVNVGKTHLTISFMSRFEQYAEKRDALHKELSALGVEAVTIEYHGSGDSGGIEDIKYKPDNKLPKLNNQIEEIGYGILGDKVSGYENNDGASGTITWDILKNEFSMEHNEYYTETNLVEFSPEEFV